MINLKQLKKKDQNIKIQNFLKRNGNRLQNCMKKLKSLQKKEKIKKELKLPKKIQNMII